ncbi:hypothetical protein CWI84_05670 [Idiomarina tyrosinivorans]|uniref:DUF3192 domain-containing protein n=1 Tax=Idiomarina tyrosinivorans TaxID=1445662 RepID=A0A432ZRU0_9GAMM|nr:DUF3192 domain-containing protein [Idiomarina tyrosinivorans]RUO80546.1 hypothetical protein CWI84_05670 [Idiomarina tyrosinivorans]
MNLKVIKILVIGFVLYGAFAAVVLSLYEANPDDMQWQERETFNAKQIGKLNLGMTKDALIRLLGSPDITEAKETPQGNVQVLFYRTHHVTSDGVTTKDECTALLFRDNELIAWGDSAYKDYLTWGR